MGKKTDRFNKDFLADINKLYEKYNVDTGMVQSAFNVKIRDEAHKRIIEKSKENQFLVGKCFVRDPDIEIDFVGNRRSSLIPPMKHYYKVLSEQSENEYRVECLEFDEHPTYWFNHKFSLVGNPGDCYLGRFKFASIKVSDCMASYIEKLKEISLEEYNTAMRKYIEELISLKWCTENHRFEDKDLTEEA